MSWLNFNLQDFAFAFLGVLFESIPFLLLGALISGLIEVFVPARLLTRLLPKNASAAIALSGLLGAVFPMCECGVVPVIRRLMQKGLPVSCAITYLLSAPVVNPIVAISTFAAFKGQSPLEMTAWRLGLSFGIAVVVGLIVLRLRPDQFLHPRVVETLPGQATRRTAFRMTLAGAPLVPALAGAGSASDGSSGTSTDDASAAAVAVAPFSLEGAGGRGDGARPGVGDPLAAVEAELLPSFPRRLLLALQRGAEDFLDVATFVIIGAALASVFNTAVDQTLIYPLATNPWLSVGTLMTLAFLVAVCSTSDAFIAATLTIFPFSARLAFLTFGPMVDIKLMFLYSLIFRRRFVVALALGLFVVIGLICVRLSSVLNV